MKKLTIKSMSNMTFEQIEAVVDHNQLIDFVNKPKKPMDTFHALKAIYNHVDAKNAYPCYTTALKAVSRWNGKHPAPQDTVYLHRAQRGYTVKAFKQDLRKGMLSAWKVKLYHETDFTSHELSQYDLSNMQELITAYKRRTRQHKAMAERRLKTRPARRKRAFRRRVEARKNAENF